MARPAIITIVLIALLTGACGGDSGGPPVTSPAYERFRSQPTACGAEAPGPAVDMSFEAPEDLDLTGTVEAVITTSCGEIRIDLDPSVAPATVNSFVFLAEQGYFDGTAAHRVVPGYIVQAGDPTASGGGYPGYRLPDELPGPDFLYAAGTVAMANAGANTGGSQFFIMLGDVALPPSYAVFGQVTAGADTLARIASVPLSINTATFEESVPRETIYLERVEIVR
jgi:peptidyl-prolyl cis-trans isomerase B (cyclophilin B)